MEAMSCAGSSSSGGSSSQPKYNFERTYVVQPKGKHLATIVWLHALGDNGSNWFEFLKHNPWKNIKWICPTAPLRPITLFGGFFSTAWSIGNNLSTFTRLVQGCSTLPSGPSPDSTCGTTLGFDVKDLSDNTFVDEEGLDASAAHVACLLADEPSGIKLVVGGFGMGAATSLYSALCFAHGRFENGNKYKAKLSAIVASNGWLPCSKILNRQIGAIEDAATLSISEARSRAASLYISLRHNEGDSIIPETFSEESFWKLCSFGFQNVTFIKLDESENGPHVPDMSEMEGIVSWLTEKLGLSSSAS